jgi:hypothetical protein
MRLPALLLAAAIASTVGLMSGPQSASAGFYNRDGCGIYSPAEPPTRHGPRMYRYDPRSWCYKSRGYYPYYGSAYWVPRPEMRYRYRYVYRGPRYTYYPAWGYGW